MTLAAKDPAILAQTLVVTVGIIQGSSYVDHVEHVGQSLGNANLKTSLPLEHAVYLELNQLKLTKCGEEITRSNKRKTSQKLCILKKRGKRSQTAPVPYLRYSSSRGSKASRSNCVKRIKFRIEVLIHSHWVRHKCRLDWRDQSIPIG